MAREKTLPRDEALDALAEVIVALKDERQKIEGRLRFQLAAAVEWARTRVVEIEALKRPRPKPKTLQPELPVVDGRSGTTSSA